MPSPSASTATPRVSAWPNATVPGYDRTFVGRDDETAEMVRRLVEGTAPALALIGLGGVGKTRLAAEIARRAGDALEGRVAWVRLTVAARDGGVAAALGAALDERHVEPERLPRAIADGIGTAPALLVVDAAESRRESLPYLEKVRQAAPNLRILVTSRISVSRPGWTVVAVEPLAVPDETAPLEAILASPSVALLVARAGDAGADVAITDRTAGVIARLVNRLDGMPLAIELAAPLLRVLPPHRILDRIGERLDPVVATIDWSHDQLDPDDRRLYRRLAVFGAPFRARHVRTFAERSLAHGLAPLGPGIAAGLERLAAAGLIRAHADPGEGPDAASGPDDPRGSEVREYLLPALIRDDAERRLEASGEATAAHWARANDLLALCELSHAELMIRSRVDLLEQLDVVHDDLIAALDRARVAGEWSFMLRLAGSLAEYWRARGRLGEGRVQLDIALRGAAPTRTKERALALHGAGVLANWQSDFRRARAALEEALSIRLELGLLADAAATLNQLGLIGLDLGDLDDAERACRQGLEIRRQLGEPSAIAASLNTLGGVLHFGGKADEAAACYDESVAIRRQLDDEAGLSVSLANLALVHRDRGDLDTADAMLRESLGTRERLGDRQRVAVVRHNLALVLFDRGDLAGAEAALEESIAAARELGDRLEAANAMSDLGFVTAAGGDRSRAAAFQHDALILAARIGAKGIVAQSIDGIAGLLAADGDVADAAVLWGAAETIRRDARYFLLAADRRRIDRAKDAARAALDDEAWEESWAAGEGLSLDAAVERARVAIGASVEASSVAAAAAVAV